MTQRRHVDSTRHSPSTLDSAVLAEVLAKDGQLLLPMLDLIANAQCAVDRMPAAGRGAFRRLQSATSV